MYNGNVRKYYSEWLDIEWPFYTVYEKLMFFIKASLYIRICMYVHTYLRIYVLSYAIIRTYDVF